MDGFLIVVYNAGDSYTQDNLMNLGDFYYSAYSFLMFGIVHVVNDSGSVQSFTM